MSKKNKIIAVLIAFICTIGGYGISTNLIIAISASLDHRFFIVKSTDLTKIQKGDYIQFHLTPFQKNYYNEIASEKKDGDITAIKIVKAIPGEVIENKENCFYSNGEGMGCAKVKSRTGKKMDSFKFSGLIPEASFFVMGTNIDSFDSRYLGFVEVKNAIAILRPLF